MIIIYGFVFFLPFKIYKEYTPYDFWGRGEGLLSELLQFLLYFSSFVLSFLITWQQRRAIDRKQIISWILLGLFCLFVACEEISLLDHLKGGIESIKQINAQNETNFHNQDYFLVGLVGSFFQILKHYQKKDTVFIFYLFLPFMHTQILIAIPK